MLKRVLALFVAAVGVTNALPLCDDCQKDDGVLLMQNLRLQSSDDVVQKTVHEHLQAGRYGAMSQALGQLAADVVKGKTVLPEATRAALQGIWDEMEKVFTAAKDAHATDQMEVDFVDNAVKRCDDDISDNEEWGEAAIADNTAHDECRAEEKALREKNTTLCEDFYRTVTAPDTPDCIFQYPKSPTMDDVARMLTCLGKMASWAPVHKDSLSKKKVDCESATNDYRAQVELCNRKQTSYEDAFCGYHKDLTTRCDAYATCRDDSLADQQKIHDAKEKQMASRNVEFSAAKHVQCFLGVLNATASEQAKLLKDCASSGADTGNTDQFNISFHTAPERSCDQSPVASRPCDTQWTTTYQQKAWYSQAPTLTCKECSHLTTTTTTTTTTTIPTSTTEELVAMSGVFSFADTPGGGSVSGATWTQSGSWNGARGDHVMCIAGDTSEYKFSASIQGTYHMIGVAPETCCHGQSTYTSTSNDKFAALYSHSAGWNRHRGAARPVGSPTAQSWWSGAWDGNIDLVVTVKCSSKSFVVGRENDHFLGEMSWPQSWPGVYAFVGGQSSDHRVTMSMGGGW